MSTLIHICRRLFTEYRINYTTAKVEAGRSVFAIAQVRDGGVDWGGSYEDADKRTYSGYVLKVPLIRFLKG